jgi:phosphoenolpyruvate synthase/pyruvate phosphate dikinase
MERRRGNHGEASIVISDKDTVRFSPCPVLLAQAIMIGVAFSDYPDFAAFLVRAGIESISLNPDSVVEVKQRVAEVEKELKV